MSNGSGRRLPRWIEPWEGEQDEAEVCRHLTPDQRGERLVQCCRLAMAILRGRPDSDRVLAFRDPLPESSVELLDKLRKRYARP